MSDDIEAYGKYLTQKQIERNAPDELLEKSQTDTVRKLYEGLQDIKDGKVYSEEEIDDIIDKL
jgi:predicted transcriptional regulator